MILEELRKKYFNEVNGMKKKINNYSRINHNI